MTSDSNTDKGQNGNDRGRTSVQTERPLAETKPSSPIPIPGKLPVRNRSRHSSLSQLFAEDTFREDGKPRHHPGLAFGTVNPSAIKPTAAMMRTKNSLSNSLQEAWFFNHVLKDGGYDLNAANGFRDYTTGQPRLTPFPPSPVNRPSTPRRGTISHLPEIDHLLMPHRYPVAGLECLVLGKRAVDVLAPFVNGMKPISDLSVFHNVAIALPLAQSMPEWMSLALKGIKKYVLGAVVITGVGKKTIEQVQHEARLALGLLDKRERVVVEA